MPGYESFLDDIFVFGDTEISRIDKANNLFYDYKLDYMPGKIALRYRIETRIRQKQLPEFAPLSPVSIEIIDKRKSDKRVIPYTEITKQIMQEMLIPGDSIELIHKLMTLKMDYANSLWQKLKTKKYDLSRSSTKAKYEIDLKLYTLLNNISYYTSVSLTGLPDIRDETGDEPCLSKDCLLLSDSKDNGIGSYEYHRMLHLMRKRLEKLVNIIYDNRPIKIDT